VALSLHYRTLHVAPAHHVSFFLRRTQSPLPGYFLPGPIALTYWNECACMLCMMLFACFISATLRSMDIGPMIPPPWTRITILYIALCEVVRLGQISIDTASWVGRGVVGNPRLRRGAGHVQRAMLGPTAIHGTILARAVRATFPKGARHQPPNLSVKHSPSLFRCPYVFPRYRQTRNLWHSTWHLATASSAAAAVSRCAI
jgi:hypothetical protein